MSDAGDSDQQEGEDPAPPVALPSFEELLELSGERRLDEIRELVLRSRGITEVGSLLQPLRALEVLSLSNNLLSSLHGCATTTSLLVLNVNFNRIASLEPLSACPSLSKLFASTNRVGSVAPLAGCSELRVISLFHNRIASLDQTIDVLRQLPYLEELDLAANPAALGSPYRHRLIGELKLTSLDGDTITELDQQMANGFLEASHAAQPVDIWRADREGLNQCPPPPSLLRASSQALPESLPEDLPRTPSQAPLHQTPPHPKSFPPAPLTPPPPTTGLARRTSAARPLTAAAAGALTSTSQRPATALARPSTSAGTARLFRDPYLNSHPILLEYLSESALERHATCGSSGCVADADSSVLSLRRPMVERLRKTAAVMEGCQGNSVNQLAQSELFGKHEAEETEEVRRIRQLIHRVQELTAERDEAIEKAARLEDSLASRDASTAQLEQLRAENAALRTENANMFTLMDENAELRTEVETLKLQIECIGPSAAA